MSGGIDFLSQRYETLKGTFMYYLNGSVGNEIFLFRGLLWVPFSDHGGGSRLDFASVSPGFQLNGRNCPGSRDSGHLLLTLMEKWNHPSSPSWAYSVTVGTSHLAGKSVI